MSDHMATNKGERQKRSNTLGSLLALCKNNGRYYNRLKLKLSPKKLNPI